MVSDRAALEVRTCMFLPSGFALFRLSSASERESMTARAT